MRREIGHTRISVNAIGLGAWQLSNVGRPGEKQAIEVIRNAIDAGVDLIDTADAYCLDESDFGHGERLVGKALAAVGSRGGEITVATKVGRIRPGGRWVSDARPEYVRAACEASLKRLAVETITLYQLHQVDPDVPLEETMGALRDLRDAGKVRHVGLSNVGIDQIEHAQRIVRVESVQNRCNPWARDDVDSGLIHRCAEMGVTYIPWHPVGGEEGHRACASNPVLLELAHEYGASPYQLLLGWLLSLGEMVVPIPGATRVASILDSLGASRLSIEPEDLDRIGAIARRGEDRRVPVR